MIYTPFSRRQNNAGQTILIIAPSGHGKNVLLKNILKDHLAGEYLLLFSDSCGLAVDKNDIWYDGPVLETSRLVEVMKGLTAQKFIEPIYVIIDDPRMDKKTIDYLSEMVRMIRHTKISLIILFQKFTKEISPDLRHNARLVYFSSKCGRTLLENLYAGLSLSKPKKEFLADVGEIAKKYTFVNVDNETGDIVYFKPPLCDFRYKFNFKRKLRKASK